MAGGASVGSCSGCSGGSKVRYVGNNGGTLQFNGVSASTAGSAQLTIAYANGGTTSRTAQLSINDGSASTFTFVPTGDWSTVGTLDVTVNLQAGNNTLKFFNTTNMAPDFDRIISDDIQRRHAHYYQHGHSDH